MLPHFPPFNILPPKKGPPNNSKKKWMKISISNDCEWQLKVKKIWWQKTSTKFWALKISWNFCHWILSLLDGKLSKCYPPNFPVANWLRAEKTKHAASLRGTLTTKNGRYTMLLNLHVNLRHFYVSYVCNHLYYYYNYVFSPFSHCSLRWNPIWDRPLSGVN